MSTSIAPAHEIERQSFARRRPMMTFLVLAFGIGWPAVAIPLMAGVPADPFLLVVVFLGLLTPALVVTRLAGGPGAVKRLVARASIWRFGLFRWAVIVLGVPALTLVLAAASGTLSRPTNGVVMEGGTYLFATFVFGAVILNVWEELAWGGFAQSRLMARHGLLVGSLLTAPLFAAIHVPLLFASGWTWSDVAIDLGVLCAAAPFYRYLLGMHLLGTGGSVLAIGVQHAAWNAAGNIDGVDGEWQSTAAVVLLTVLLALRRRGGHAATRPVGREAEMAAASGWLPPDPDGADHVPAGTPGVTRGRD